MIITSDTNVWLDFSFIGEIDHPFLLDNIYYLSSITYHDEIDDKTNIPNIATNKEHFSDIRKYVKDNKILLANETANELKLAVKYVNEYRPPKITKAISMQDSLALAIAKERKWILLTGDSGLREAAKIEDVECHGTLWIYDQLLVNNMIQKDKNLNAMYKLLDAVDNKKRYLPKTEIQKRIESINKTKN